MVPLRQRDTQQHPGQKSYHDEASGTFPSQGKLEDSFWGCEAITASAPKDKGHPDGFEMSGSFCNYDGSDIDPNHDFTEHTNTSDTTYYDDDDDDDMNDLLQSFQSSMSTAMTSSSSSKSRRPRRMEIAPGTYAPVATLTRSTGLRETG